VPEGGGSPETHNAEVLSAPAVACLALAVFKSLTSVQLVPFQLSVFAILEPGNSPAEANADVCVPEPPKLTLPVFKSLTSVQLVPS
jgi:hypothetical protein